MIRDFERYLDTLRGSDLFRGIDADRLPQLLDRLGARVVKYARGETIYHCGDRVTESALVLEGTVIIEDSDIEDEYTNLDVLRAGEAFGAVLALSGNGKSPMHVYAGARCAILVFNLQDAGRWAASGDEEWRLVNNIMASFAGKCADLYRKVQIYGKKRIRSRIQLYLMTLDMVDGEVVLPLNRTELAEYLGVDRTALARELTRMRQEGIIAVNKRRVRILDPGFVQRGSRDAGAKTNGENTGIEKNR